MVGGFAANDWLFNKVEEGLKSEGITVIRPENHVYGGHYVIVTPALNNTAVGTRLYPMEPFHSTSTTMSQRESQSSHTANSEQLSTTLQISTM